MSVYVVRGQIILFMIKRSAIARARKRLQLSSYLLFFPPLDLLARSLRSNVLGAVGGSKTCIVSIL